MKKRTTKKARTLDSRLVEERMVTDHDFNQRDADLRAHQAHIDDLRDRVKQLEAGLGPTWKTQAGIVLRMRDMSDSHLDNAILFLERQSKETGYKQKTVEWKAAWMPKLAELQDEKARREKSKPTSFWQREAEHLRAALAKSNAELADLRAKLAALSK